MKKYLKKLSLLLSVVLFLLVSCSKDDTEAAQASTYNLASNETLPGNAIEIKSNKPITESEIEVMIDDKPVKAYANGEYSYVFITPILASGNYNLKFSVVNNDITLNLKVNNYVAIINPEEVISEFVVNRDKCFDAIKERGLSLETLVLIDQIKEEWDFQYSKNTMEDKLLLAYIVQKNTLNPDLFKTSSSYPDNYRKSSLFVSDAGEKLVSTAKEFVTAQNICLSSIPALVGTGTLFLSAPNFVTGAIFIATFTVFVVSREVAIQKAKEVGSLEGVAEAVSDVSYQKIATLELVKDTDTDISMKINFRNLKTTDINIQTDITKAFNEEKKFADEDNRVKTLYDKTIKFTEKLKGLYVNYVSLIGKTSEKNITLTVLDKDIIVQGSSNTEVKISTSLNGDVRKIKATSNSATDVNFNLKIAYKRAIDGKEIVKEIPSVFKANVLVGTWTLDLTLGTGLCDETLLEDEAGIPPTLRFNSNGTVTFDTDPVGSNLNGSGYKNLYNLNGNVLKIQSSYIDGSDNIQFNTDLTYNLQTQKFLGTYTNKWTDGTICKNNVVLHK